MKFGVFLSLFSCCFYLVCSAVIENPKYESSDKTQITDLRDDCLLIILEELELGDLVAVAETNEYLSHLAGDVFRRRYSSFDIISYGSYHVEWLTSSLRLFGHLIHELSIEFRFVELEDFCKIGGAINSYCAETLNHVNFIGLDEEFLSAFTKPFTSVETIKFDGRFRSSDVKALKLNEIFPGVRKLIIGDFYVFDPIMFDVQFAQLEHFDISFFYTYRNSRIYPQDTEIKRRLETNVKNLLKKNPTVKSLVFHHCYSVKLLRIASEYCSNVEEIRAYSVFELDEYSGGPIRFPSVKNVNFLWESNKNSGLISFEKIENLFLQCSSHECIDFFKANPNVTNLVLTGASHLSDEEISQIGDLLPILVELDLGSCVRPGANPFPQLIQKNTHLEKIVFSVIGDEKLFDAKDYVTLGEQASADWTVNISTEELKMYGDSVLFVNLITLQKALKF